MEANWGHIISTSTNCDAGFTRLFILKVIAGKVGYCRHSHLQRFGVFSVQVLQRKQVMSEKRFIMNSSRSSRQGALINVGKDSEEYIALTSSMTMSEPDMAEIGLSEGQMAIVRTEFGEAQFKCQAGKVPDGMIFVPYCPPTCKLMGGDTDGTGMPTSKGWEVEIVQV